MEIHLGGMEALAVLVRVLFIVILPIVDLCYLGFAILFCWGLRDGLGPDSIESTGIHAYSRFWAAFKWHLLFGSIPLVVAFVFMLGCFRNGVPKKEDVRSNPDWDLLP